MALPQLDMVRQESEIQKKDLRQQLSTIQEEAKKQCEELMTALAEAKEESAALKEHCEQLSSALKSGNVAQAAFLTNRLALCLSSGKVFGRLYDDAVNRLQRLSKLTAEIKEKQERALLGVIETETRRQTINLDAEFSWQSRKQSKRRLFEDGLDFTQDFQSQSVPGWSLSPRGKRTWQTRVRAMLAMSPRRPKTTGEGHGGRPRSPGRTAPIPLQTPKSVASQVGLRKTVSSRSFRLSNSQNLEVPSHSRVQKLVAKPAIQKDPTLVGTKSQPISLARGQRRGPTRGTVYHGTVYHHPGHNTTSASDLTLVAHRSRGMPLDGPLGCDSPH